MFENIVDMCHEREVRKVNHAELGLAVDGLGHTPGYNKRRLQRHAREDIHGLLVGLALAQEDADLPGPAAVDCDVKVAYSEDCAVLVRPLDSGAWSSPWWPGRMLQPGS